MAKIADLEGHEMRVLYSAISPDGQTVLTGAADEDLKFWKTFEHKKGGRRAAAAASDDGTDGLAKAMKKVTIR